MTFLALNGRMGLGKALEKMRKRRLRRETTNDTEKEREGKEAASRHREGNETKREGVLMSRREREGVSRGAIAKKYQEENEKEC